MLMKLTTDRRGRQSDESRQYQSKIARYEKSGAIGENFFALKIYQIAFLLIES